MASKSESEFLKEPTEAKAVPHVPMGVGRWKTGLCGCCSYGCCHPVVCWACWFSPVLLAQVLTRMKMSWMGGVGTSPQEYKKTFKIVVAICLVAAIIIQKLKCSELIVDYDYDSGEFSFIPNPDCQPGRNAVAQILQLCLLVYVLIVGIRLRKEIRARYTIPEHCCPGMEDCCCLFWCTCCSVVQMAHQTADYDIFRATCCTETGLPPGVDIDSALIVTSADVV